jgi:hypothetical protein
VATTRVDLQRVAVHVLARRRHAASGRFGLRATPGGFGTPSFGPPEEPEVLRVSGTTLLHEAGGSVRTASLVGTSLGELAAFAGVDLAAPFSAGDDTPEVGDPRATLAVDPAAAAELASWFDLGWRALDAVVDGAREPTALQLWPEHFDAGCSVVVGPGPDDRANLGASPGDDACPEPYLYVGPWGARRPGDPRYWNAPFGAVLVASAMPADDRARAEAAVAFLRRGIALLGSG